MIDAVLSMSGMALAAGIGLGLAAKKFHVQADPLGEKLVAILPGSNCGNCGFPGCQAYADSLAASLTDGGVAINLCTPGGVPTIKAIADLLGVEPVAAKEEHGPRVAFIDETRCIGCTACIKACPVDAIVGANKQSHTVIVSWCTDCEACVEPCPVDCIAMVPVVATLYDWHWEKPTEPVVHSVR
ncbi:MAG: electron transport complex subunit RsxB [Magnetococcales bacterium]|nr:electron transport complex subunit RsxB [Magnetococcales bacterium]MBF0116860.1 electron transport complex subunit RsxB [Magnetococcales bacterium]